MNNSTKFEDRASSSPSTHEGEPSESLCDRLSRTRDTHNLDPSGAASANIRLINRRSNMLRLLLALSSRNSKSNRNDKKTNPTDSQGWTGSLHIRDPPGAFYRSEEHTSELQS